MKPLVVLPADLSQAIASTDKQVLVFYRRIFHTLGVEGRLLSGLNTAPLLHGFCAKQFKVLLVSSRFLVGFRLPINPEDVQVIFVGTQWDEAEIAQGCTRCHLPRAKGE